MYVCTVQIKIKFPFRIRRTLVVTLRRVITEGTLEPCYLHLVLSTCLIALVVVAVDITKLMNIIVGHVSEGDKARNYVTVVLPEFYEYGMGTLF